MQRTGILTEFILEALKNYGEKNGGQVPRQLVIWRDGVGGPTFQEKVMRLEGPGG